MIMAANRQASEMAQPMYVTIDSAFFSADGKSYTKIKLYACRNELCCKTKVCIPRDDICWNANHLHI